MPRLWRAIAVKTPARCGLSWAHAELRGTTNSKRTVLKINQKCSGAPLAPCSEAGIPTVQEDEDDGDADDADDDADEHEAVDTMT